MTNAYDSTRGNTTDRQRRKAWLLNAYRADVDVLMDGGEGTEVIAAKPAGDKVDRYEDDWTKACRCYRCGALLTEDTVTVDRIVPGCQGGTYRRSNIRPACVSCNSSTGAKLAGRSK